MCSRAFRTAFPCGSTTAFLGVMMIFAFIFWRVTPRSLCEDGGESQFRMLVISFRSVERHRPAPRSEPQADPTAHGVPGRIGPERSWRYLEGGDLWTGPDS